MTYWPIHYLGSDVTLALEAATNVTNHYTTPSSGIIVDTLYQNTGETAATQAFVTSGLVPLTAAMIANGFTISLSAAAPNWLLNAARINFYSAATPSIPNLVSSVTGAGVVLSADARNITVTAGSIPGAATHFGTNMKWAQGIPSLIYTSSNVIPTGADTELAGDIMVNSGTTAACLTAYGAAGTSESVSTETTLAANEFLVIHEGYTTYLRRPWQANKHMVHKVVYSPETHDYNNTYQFNSVAEIASSTPAALTPGAWTSAISATGANATTYAVWSDCHPAYKLNSMYMGGAHGVTSSLVTSAGHGKANVDRGSLWSIGGTQYRLTGVYDANRVIITALNTGTATAWAIASTTITAGTATHVSGATNTGNFVISSGVGAYLMPATYVLKNKVWLEGARQLTADGAYVATQRIQDFNYRIPNAASVLDYVTANVGSSSDLLYNNSSITMQLQADIRWIDDAWSSAVLHQITALQDHHCNFSWPMQWQAINFRSGSSETLWFIIPGTISCAASTDVDPTGHTNGSPLNFSSWVNISTNAKQYFHDSAVWAASSFWSDNTQRPAWISAYGVKNSGNAWMRKFIMARSRIEGWTASGNPEISHFLSASNKTYANTRFEDDVVTGDVRMNVAGYGWMDPAFDTSASINFAFPLGGGQYEWNWWAESAVTNYVVPQRDDLEGKQKTIICRSANCVVSVATNGQVTVSASAGGGFTALVF